jgi:hypothetical protein
MDNLTWFLHDHFLHMLLALGATNSKLDKDRQSIKSTFFFQIKKNE